MSKRRTMGGVILNESVCSPSIPSPLRRKSLALPVQPIVEKDLFSNDDESEIIARRKQPIILDSSRTAETSERRFSLGLLPGLSGNDILEHYNKCIKLCTENKINPKNVFALSMIDYMTVLTKKNRNSNEMQTGSTTLDVGTKIYSVKVDCVHTDMIKMVGEPDKKEKDKENSNNTGADDNLNTTNGQGLELKRKKKRNKLQKIIGTEENVSGTLETINLCSKTNYSDSQTTDMLLQVTLPIHVTSGHNLHLWEDVIFDLKPDIDRNLEGINPEVEIPAVENLEKLDICSSFKTFSITNWSIDDVPDSPSPPRSPSNGGLEFDFNASLVDNCNGDNTGMNYFDLENDGQENVDRCIRRGVEEPEKIVDFIENVADKSKDKSADYSYMQKSLTNFHWSGPVHWKPRITSKVPNGSNVVGACRQEAVKKKKEPIFDFIDDFSEDFSFKLKSKIPRKLQSKTLRLGWHEDKLTLPEDVHYANSNPSKFYIHSTATMVLKLDKKPEDKGDTEEAQAEDDVNYDYNNLNDTQDYCSQNNVDNEINGDDDNNSNRFENHDDMDDDNDQEQNENPFGDIYTQGFIGENLVIAPKSTQQIHIQYSIKAKKIDMRQLKKGIWKALTMRNGVNNMDGEVGDEELRNIRNSTAGEIIGPQYFDQVYKQLPNLLGKYNAESLSPALALTSLLHLANEKSLDITSVSDLSDFTITQG